MLDRNIRKCCPWDRRGEVDSKKRLAKWSIWYAYAVIHNYHCKLENERNFDAFTNRIFSTSFGCWLLWKTRKNVHLQGSNNHPSSFPEHGQFDRRKYAGRKIFEIWLDHSLLGGKPFLGLPWNHLKNIVYVLSVCDIDYWTLCWSYDKSALIQFQKFLSSCFNAIRISTESLPSNFTSYVLKFFATWYFLNAGLYSEFQNLNCIFLTSFKIELLFQLIQIDYVFNGLPRCSLRKYVRTERPRPDENLIKANRIL